MLVRRVQVAGGLVGQQQGGLGDQGAGDGHALLLAARELARTVAHAVREAHDSEGVLGAFLAFLGRERGQQEGQLDVLQRAGARQQVEALEDEADAAVADVGQPVATQFLDALSVQFVGAPTGPVEAADDVHERRFA